MSSAIYIAGIAITIAIFCFRKKLFPKKQDISISKIELLVAKLFVGLFAFACIVAFIFQGVKQ